MIVPFNKPHMTGRELSHIAQAHFEGVLAGDGRFTKECQDDLQRRTGSRKVLLTHSCTAALEMAALLLDIQPGDEVIMPSYTFVSTANAFVLRGAVPVFVDIRPDTLNLDEQLIEAAITPRTTAAFAVARATSARFCAASSATDASSRARAATPASQRRMSATTCASASLAASISSFSCAIVVRGATVTSRPVTAKLQEESSRSRERVTGPGSAASSSTLAAAAAFVEEAMARLW